MPGPEQRKLLEEALRKEHLQYLRDYYNNKPEKQSSRLSSVVKSADVNKQKTTTAARAGIPSPITNTTNHNIKTTDNKKMPIYKYNPSPASPKRKAEDIDDGFELDQGDRPRQGHVTKKAKLTSGYVPGTGKPYRGTARERPHPPPLGSIGVLGDKPANVPFKRREAVAKQDTKNLNRNAPKSKVLNEKSTSQPSQGAVKVAEPRAIDDGTTKRLQHTKSDASKAARLGTLNDASQEPPQAIKRKRGHDLEDEPKKKAKIGPSTASPLRELKVGVNAVPQHRTSSFFMHIQKPGNTAAIPTNVRHVQEVVEKPTSRLPKTPQTTPIVKEAEAGAQGQKRPREDDAEFVRPKRAKLSTPGNTGRKTPSIDEVSAELLKGLHNHKKACFANAGLQCLFGIPEFLAHYEAFETNSSEEVQSRFVEYTAQKPKAKPKAIEELRQQLISAVEGECFIGPHLSGLVRTLRKAEGKSISPREFLNACGVFFRDENNHPLDGDTPQDTAQFIIELLNKLHDEEVMERTKQGDAANSSIVEELFHVKGGNELSCKDCDHKRKIAGQPIADHLALSVILPASEATATLGELLEQTKTSELLINSPCPGLNCNKTDTTRQQAYVERLPKYLVVQAPRARYIEEQHGLSDRDRRMQPSVNKNHTSVKVPAIALDLSFLLDGEGSREPHHYEVFGVVEHRGSNDDGHYVAFRKIQDNWHLFDDEKVKQIQDEELTTQGQIFFLRRRE